MTEPEKPYTIQRATIQWPEPVIIEKRRIPPAWAGWIALVSATVSIVGGFLPWVKFAGLFAGISITGMDTSDGRICASLMLIPTAAGVLAIRSNARTWVSVLGLIASTLVTVILVSDTSSLSSGPYATIGSGLYLSMAGAACAIVGTFALTVVRVDA